MLANFVEHEDFQSSRSSGNMSEKIQEVLIGYIDESVNATIDDNAQQSKVIDEQLAKLGEEQMETMVLDSLFIMLASPEFMVQR